MGSASGLGGMDYNVFLLSRVHEAYNEGDGPRESVIHGMSRIGKVILFAGLIMSAVFLAFVTQSDVIAKMFGLGLGLAVLIDVLDAAVAAILRTVGLPDTEARAVCAVLWAGPTDPPTLHGIEPMLVEGHYDDPQTDW